MNVLGKSRRVIDVEPELDGLRLAREQGNWYPACGGTETPTRYRSGRTLLYVWQPSTGRHAYLDMGTDLILSDEEAGIAVSKY